MSRVFLDAAFVIAAKLKRDENHGDAVKAWDEMIESGVHLTTTSFVLDEIATFLNSRGDHSTAVEACEVLLSGSSIYVDFVDEQLFRKGWDYFIRHHDKGYSLTDCISFVLMQDLGILQSLTFDQHFRQAGFDVIP